MAQVHGLSDDQVNQELRKMTAFIRQEAQEKAREITIKANEEFSIEKSRLVRQETDAIDALYEQKRKQAVLSQQIARSTITNKTRLRVLAASQEVVDGIFDRAQAELAATVAQNKALYQETLTNLLLEGFYTLDEPAVSVRARKADVDMVKKAISTAAAEYEKTLGRKVVATVDEANPVSSESAGGVVIVSGSGKIDIDNTLDTRLNLLKDNALPAVREALFGKNPNRKFCD